MENIDDDWESFLQNDGEMNDFQLNNNDTIYEKNEIDNVRNFPKCSEIYISTKTKISYLNIKNIDIKDVFWKIPIINYSSPTCGAIKKQIKFSSSTKEELDIIECNLKNTKYYEEQIIEHIENPNGRIKFKDQRKISIGICKKDLMTYRSKKKRAFFNCFVIILRLFHNSEFKEMHVKVFNTGKLEIPGIQTDDQLDKILNLLVDILKPILGNEVDYITEKNETVLINSNFNCGYYINRDNLHDLLKYKYRINSIYDACSYPGIQSKFYYDLNETQQTGQQPKHKNYHEISFMIFRTGSVLIVGKCEEPIIFKIYDFIKNILEVEYTQIKSSNIIMDDIPIKTERKKKIRKKTIICN